LERICGLLQVDKPSHIDLRKEGIKSPIPRLKNNGQKIILYDRGQQNYMWQIGQAFISILKKRLHHGLLVIQIIDKRKRKKKILLIKTLN